MANEIGSFLGKWIIAEAIPGAVLLHLQALVTVAPVRKVNGRVRMTQATNPPLDVDIDVSGKFCNLTIADGKRHVVSLQNVPSPLFGAPSLDIVMVMEDDWKTGRACYSSQVGSGHFEACDVSVKVEE